MKKQFFSILAVAAALVIGLSSCSNDDPANALEVNKERNATVSGNILIQQNLKPDADGKKYYAVPQMSTADIIATVEYKDLTGNPAAKGVYTVPADKITFDSSTGKYTVTAPVGNVATKITITLSDIKGTQNQQTGVDGSGVAIYTQKNGVWKATAPSKQEPSLSAGQTKDEGKWVLTFQEGKQNGSEV